MKWIKNNKKSGIIIIARYWLRCLWFNVFFIFWVGNFLGKCCNVYFCIAITFHFIRNKIKLFRFLWIPLSLLYGSIVLYVEYTSKTIHCFTSKEFRFFFSYSKIHSNKEVIFVSCTKRQNKTSNETIATVFLVHKNLPSACVCYLCSDRFLLHIIFLLHIFIIVICMYFLFCVFYS